MCLQVACMLAKVLPGWSQWCLQCLLVVKPRGYHEQIAAQLAMLCDHPAVLQLRCEAACNCGLCACLFSMTDNKHLEDAVDGLHACRDSSCCSASAGLACYMVASTVGYICQEV